MEIFLVQKDYHTQRLPSKIMLEGGGIGIGPCELTKGCVKYFLGTNKSLGCQEFEYKFFTLQGEISPNKFFLLNFGRHLSFYGATDTPVLDFWWCHLWFLHAEWTALFGLDRGVCDIYLLWNLWCGTCWALDGQHGDQSIFPTCMFQQRLDAGFEWCIAV